MVGFNTCENWEKGLFFLRETLERNDSEATVANDMPVVLYEEMADEELKSIRAIQKENGSNLRIERVRKAKGYFFKKLEFKFCFKLVCLRIFNNSKGVQIIEFTIPAVKPLL